MSDVSVRAEWRGGLRFESAGRAGVAVVVDGDGEAGPTPVETLLVGFASCMAADVAEILTKMRVPLASLTVEAEGDRRPEPPRRYTAIRLVYRAGGIPASDRDKLQRAVDLSREKYCSVLHSLRPDIALSIRVETG